MSNYCSNCTYSPSKKTGEGACPFNPLYWHFMDRHRDQLESNHRIGRIYSTWDRMDDDRKKEYLDSADAHANWNAVNSEPSLQDFGVARQGPGPVDDAPPSCDTTCVGGDVENTRREPVHVRA